MRVVRLPWYRRLSQSQLVLTAALLVIGLATVYSATASDLRKQLLSAILGLLALGAAALLDPKRLVRASTALYIGCLLLLLFVKVHGHSALGSQRWISVAGFQVEPSELSKLVMVIVLAKHLAEPGRVTLRRVLTACALAAPPMLLILSQPDLGTAIVYGCVLGGLLFIAGAPRIQLVGLGVAAVAAVPLAPHFLHAYQRQRLEIFLDPSKDPLGAGYNLLQARIAIGSGGALGTGWLHGLQGSLGYVPERATDFIFAVFAEEFGLIGCIALLALFVLLLLSLLRSASIAPDRFTRLLVAGVAVMLFSQVVENIGMNIGLLPITGIPLPFISYGGSALVTDLTALGLVQGLMLRRRMVVHSQTRPNEFLLHEAAGVRLSA
ncbi:MAG TPA: rod shape-determining protein RodA [Candidatus Dormibacteraeota bacterium]